MLMLIKVLLCAVYRHLTTCLACFDRLVIFQSWALCCSRVQRLLARGLSRPLLPAFCQGCHQTGPSVRAERNGKPASARVRYICCFLSLSLSLSWAPASASLFLQGCIS